VVTGEHEQELKAADRSVSVPMTLSDLERLNARGQIFQMDSFITFAPFDLERPYAAG